MIPGYSSTDVIWCWDEDPTIVRTILQPSWGQFFNHHEYSSSPLILDCWKVNWPAIWCFYLMSITKIYCVYLKTKNISKVNIPKKKKKNTKISRINISKERKPPLSTSQKYENVLCQYLKLWKCPVSTSQNSENLLYQHLKITKRSCVNISK